MGIKKHEAMFYIRRGTIKRIAYKFKISASLVALLRSKFYLFDELELEALIAAHTKLAAKKLGFFGRKHYPDIHPPRPTKATQKQLDN